MIPPPTCKKGLNLYTLTRYINALGNPLKKHKTVFPTFQLLYQDKTKREDLKKVIIFYYLVFVNFCHLYIFSHVWHNC